VISFCPFQAESFGMLNPVGLPVVFWRLRAACGALKRQGKFQAGLGRKMWLGLMAISKTFFGEI